MTGYAINLRGRYKCNYCDHSTYRTVSGVKNHIEAAHPVEIAVDRVKASSRQEVDRAREDARLAARRAEIAESQVRELKSAAYKVEQRYSAVVYCPNCKTVDSVNIVQGQAIGVGGCFRCGVPGSQQVKEVNVSRGSYQ